MKKFEYKTLEFKASGNWMNRIKIDSSKLEMLLNELGNEGWELINTTDYALGGYTQKLIFFFKREK